MDIAMANLYGFLASKLLERRKSISERNNHILELVELGNKIFVSYENFLHSPSETTTCTAFISDFRYDEYQSVNLYGLPVGADKHLHFNIITAQKTLRDNLDFFGVKVEIFKESDAFFVSLGIESCVIFEFPVHRVEEYLSKMSLVIGQFVTQMSHNRAMF